MVTLPHTALGLYRREADMGDGGKGSKARPFSVSQREFDNRWDTIFRKSPQEVQDAAESITVKPVPRIRTSLFW